MALAARKDFGFLGIASAAYGYGLGLLETGSDPDVRKELTYAWIGGQEYGTPLDSLFDIRVDLQPSLVVEPDTLFFSNQEGAENEIHLWNEGTDSLRIDSLRFSTVGPASDNGWQVYLITADSTYFLEFALSRLVIPDVFPVSRLESQDSLIIKFIGFDPCLVCKRSLLRTRSPLVRDTLFIYSNDASLNPYPVPIDFARYVAAEAPGALSPSLSVEVYPNPAADRATVRVVAGEAGRYEVGLYNVLGQRLDRAAAVLVPGQAWEVVWPRTGRRLPGGTYFLRLSDGRATATTTLTLAR